MPPIRKGDGTPVAPKGISQIRTGDGRILFDGPAMPDSVEYQFNALEIDANDGDALSNWECEITGDIISAIGSPTYRDSAINGNPAVEFDGSNDGFLNRDFDNISATEGHTVFAVVEVDNSDPDANWHGRIDNPSHNLQFDGTWKTVETEGSSQDGSSDDSVQLVTTRHEENDVRIRENGSETGSSTSSIEDYEAVVIGYEEENDRRYADGYVGLIEVHEGALSDQEMADREDDIASMFDISI